MPEMKTKWRGSSVQKVTQEQSPPQKVVNMCRLPRAARPQESGLAAGRRRRGRLFTDDVLQPRKSRGSLFQILLPATSGRIDDRNAKCCTAVIAAHLFRSFAMNDVVEYILSTYQSMCPLDAERATDSRQRISRYIESLASAGQRDVEQLTIYGLAYLTELHEGQDPRFTGC
jgi:hypothetical protein